MTPRRTTTGAVLESMIYPSLEHGRYAYRKQVVIGQRIGGRRHKVDAVASKDGRDILVSLKWQQVSGTAEQKVPFEVICLAEAVRNGPYAAAYLVLGGEGWTLRTFYVAGGLKSYLVNVGSVAVLTLEAFVAKANLGRL